MNARYYDPETGRFISSDSNLAGGLNLFAYCDNNPVMLVDYDGQVLEKIVTEVKRPDGTIERTTTYQDVPGDDDPAPVIKKLYPVPGGTTGCKFNCSTKGCSHNVKHNGIDIKSKAKNMDIVASADGIVKHKQYSGSYGNLILIAYGDYLVIYAHMENLSSLKAGDKVKAGDVIGRTGKTEQSDGIHLHFGVAKNVPNNTYANLCSNKYWVDPEIWLNS